jgi:hypothetical protein
MTRSETRIETEAEKFARALTTTTDRYLNGCLTRASWDKHMKSLWGTIEVRGLRAEVMALVDPRAVNRFVRTF